MIDELIEEKAASTEYPVIDLLKNRWSPRAFSSNPIEDEKIMSLLEATRWAPSCFNEQPWNFILFKNENHEEFNKIIDVLSPGNQLWAKNAPLIMLSVAKINFEQNRKSNRHALHDVGSAVTNLTIQATSMGLYVHQMAGFDSEKAKNFSTFPTVMNRYLQLLLVITIISRTFLKNSKKPNRQIGVENLFLILSLMLSGIKNPFKC